MNDFTCITCKYNYNFNSNTNEKTCLPEHSKFTTIIKQSLTTTITTILTTTQKIKTTIPNISTTTIKVLKINIENNLFGYVYKGTKIMNIPTSLYLRNIINGNILINESIVLKNENVSLHFNSNEEYKKGNYIIEYAYVLTEPNYEDINNYTNTTKTYGDNIDEKNYYKYNEYTGKSSDFILIISNDLITNCNDEKCALCFKNYTCITCKYNYTFNKNTNEKTCHSEHSKFTTIAKQSLTTTITKILTTTQKIKTPTTIIKVPKINTAIPNIHTTTIKVLKINTTTPNIPNTTIKISPTIPFILTTIQKIIIYTTSLKSNPNQECTEEAKS